MSKYLLSCDCATHIFGWAIIDKKDYNKKTEEYLSLTEITKEEGNILMMSMTPWEKEEYDRRNR